MQQDTQEKHLQIEQINNKELHKTFLAKFLSLHAMIQHIDHVLNIMLHNVNVALHILCFIVNLPIIEKHLISTISHIFYQHAITF